MAISVLKHREHRVRTTTHDRNVIHAAVRMAETTDNPTLLAALDALIVAATLTDPVQLRKDIEYGLKREIRMSEWRRTEKKKKRA